MHEFFQITHFALRILGNTVIYHVQIIRFFVHENKTCPRFTYVPYLKRF